MTVEIPEGTWDKIKLDLRDAQRHAYDGKTGAVHEHLRVVNNRLDEIEQEREDADS